MFHMTWLDLLRWVPLLGDTLLKLLWLNTGTQVPLGGPYPAWPCSNVHYWKIKLTGINFTVFFVLVAEVLFKQIQIGLGTPLSWIASLNILRAGPLTCVTMLRHLDMFLWNLVGVTVWLCRSTPFKKFCRQTLKLFTNMRLIFVAPFRNLLRCCCFVKAILSWWKLSPSLIQYWEEFLRDLWEQQIPQSSGWNLRTVREAQKRLEPFVVSPADHYPHSLTLHCPVQWLFLVSKVSHVFQSRAVPLTRCLQQKPHTNACSDLSTIGRGLTQCWNVIGSDVRSLARLLQDHIWSLERGRKFCRRYLKRSSARQMCILGRAYHSTEQFAAPIGIRYYWKVPYFQIIEIRTIGHKIHFSAVETVPSARWTFSYMLPISIKVGIQIPTYWSTTCQYPDEASHVFWWHGFCNQRLGAEFYLSSCNQFSFFSQSSSSFCAN